jgi:flagellar hook-associated protein 3 FlgL
MRISTQQMFKPSVDAMQDLSRKLNDVQQQLSSGKRILQPSDDPAGAVQVMRLKEASATYTQFQRNGDAARNRLELEEGTLSSMQDLMQRARELNVQGNNDTYSQDDRAAIATEIDQIIEGMVQLFNTKDASGDYLFSGTASSTEPVRAVSGSVANPDYDPLDPASGPEFVARTWYVYQGDDGERSIKIGPEREVAMGDAGSTLSSLQNGHPLDPQDPANPTGRVVEILDVLQTLSAALRSDYTDTVTTDTLSGLDTLAGFDKAIEEFGLVQAKIGARLNAIDAQSETNDAAIVAIETNRSSIEDLDYAEAAARLNLQLTALQAAQQSFVRIQGLSLFNYL